MTGKHLKDKFKILAYKSLARVSSSVNEDHCTEGGGVNALEGGRGVNKEKLKFEKMGVHDPPPSSCGGAAPDCMSSSSHD